MKNIFLLNKVEGLYFSSDKITGTVIFVPVKVVEQFYWFHFENWNSYIYSSVKSGTVIFVPVRKAE